MKAMDVLGQRDLSGGGWEAGAVDAGVVVLPEYHWDLGGVVRAQVRSGGEAWEDALVLVPFGISSSKQSASNLGPSNQYIHR